MEHCIHADIHDLPAMNLFIFINAYGTAGAVNCQCCHFSKMSFVGMWMDVLSSRDSLQSVCVSERRIGWEGMIKTELVCVYVCVCACHSVTQGREKINTSTAWVGSFTSAKWWANTAAFKGPRAIPWDCLQAYSTKCQACMLLHECLSFFIYDWSCVFWGHLLSSVSIWCLRCCKNWRAAVTFFWETCGSETEVSAVAHSRRGQ